MGSIEIVCLIFSFVSMIFDIKWEKVPNYWNLCGFLSLFFLQGLEWKWIIGGITPFIVLFILFACKMIGTGDIKVFMVLGYAMGFKWIIQCMIFSFFIGACAALVILFLRCNMKQRLIYFFTYLKTVFITGTFPPYLATGQHPENTHFTIFIFCSVVLLITQGGYL